MTRPSETVKHPLGTYTRSQSHRFYCQQCDGQEFELLIQSQYEAKVHLSVDEGGNISIAWQDKQYTADLPFMNKFCTCAQCKSFGQWAYRIR